MTDRSVQDLRRRAWAWLALGSLALGGCGDGPVPVAPPAQTQGPPGRYGADGTPASAPAPGPRPDLLLVVIPELRADHCGSATKGATSAHTPHLETLAEAGDAFGHAVSPVLEPGAALASLLTGLMPERHGVSHLDPVPRLAAGFVTLGEVLRSAGGYATRAFVADDRLARAATLWQGFDVQPAVGLAEAPESVTAWMRSVPAGRPRAAVVVSDALGPGYGVKAARGDHDPKRPDARLPKRPLAMWLSSLASPPDPALPTHVENVRAHYAQGVQAADAGLAALLARLEAEGLAQNLLVVVTSTSGTGLFEHGAFGTGGSLFDEQVRIPLVFGGSVFLAGEGAAQKAASLVDVLPTLLDMLGLAEADAVDGVSLEQVLLGTTRRGPVRSVDLVDGTDQKVLLHAARALAWKYIVRYDQRAGTLVESAYDLSEDPGEQTDLAREGRVDHVGFDAAFCDGVEAVRDLVWGVAEGVNSLADGPYSQGARVLQGRPKPCVR